MPRLATLAALVLLAVASPAQADRKRDREQLKAAINDIIERTPLARSRVAVQVVSLEDGTPVYSRNADELLNPASNVKLFTTAAALARLGPEHRFDTEFLVDHQPSARLKDPVLLEKGILKGPLYVRGKGDPSISNEKLYGIACDLFHAGLREVQGDLVLDDSFFDGETNGPGFDQERSDRSYMAPVGALSLNWNTVAIYSSPGDGPGLPARIELEPASEYFTIDNKVETARARSLRRVVAKSLPNGDRQKIVAWGRVPMDSVAQGVWKKIDAPSFYFGFSLKEMLALKGIKVKGHLRRGVTPENVQTLHVHQSDTLELVMKKVNKNSSNFTAEQLLKTMGAKLRGQGSWPAGVSVVEDFLASEAGIPRGTYIMKNGSGLNDTNRFSAAQIAKLLVYMWHRFPLAPEYLSSLGIAGKDGTIHYRMVGTDAVGRLRAKTGTLENVTALSGYVQSVSGEKFAFSMMVNDYPDRASPVIAGLDAIGASMAAYGAPAGSPGGLAQVLGPPALKATLEELKARLGAFETLAAAHDPRNVTFLRTALRSERDPAMRALVADAVYRSDPADLDGARTLLENFDASADVLGRLRQVSRELQVATPVLASLEKLAAEGNAEALTRLLEITAVAKADDGLVKELLEPLAEISRNAPDELIVTLRAAREATKEAALDLIAKSLARDADDQHPFPLAVRRTQGSVDPSMALFAKALDEGLSVRIAAEKAPGVIEEAKPAEKVVAPAMTTPPELRPGG